MKHESGVEVYLVPANGTLKYPELRYEQKLLWKPNMYGTKETAEQFDARHNCCFVRHTEQRCNIVVRFNENFDMFSGSAVLIGVGIGQSKPFAKHESQSRYHGMECNTYEADVLLEKERLRSAPQFEYTVRQKTKTVFQQIVLRGPGGQGFDVPQFQEGDDFDSEEEPYYGIGKKAYQDMVNPGVLAVVVQRGNANWLDEENKPMKEQSKDGPGGPLHERPYEPGSFKHLYSENGWKLRWEFRIRSLERVLEVDERNRKRAGQPPLSKAERSGPNRYALVGDTDFYVMAKQGQDHRMALQQAWLKRPERVSRPLRVVKAPKTCGCPVHHARSSKRRKTVPEACVSTAITSRGQDFHGRVLRKESPYQAATSQPPPEPQDQMSAQTCLKCQGYKLPPRGKKFAWKASQGLWMLVPEDAPDSFQLLPDQAENDEECDEQKAHDPKLESYGVQGRLPRPEHRRAAVEADKQNARRMPSMRLPTPPHDYSLPLQPNMTPVSSEPEVLPKTIVKILGTPESSRRASSCLNIKQQDSIIDLTQDSADEIGESKQEQITQPEIQQLFPVIDNSIDVTEVLEHILPDVELSETWCRDQKEAFLRRRLREVQRRREELQLEEGAS
ncbi:hypothetical protein Slin14017_G101110 [Septoria linicola]|nr:hypothetical protein Slin14017_G101110 [Septoria linicola]